VPDVAPARAGDGAIPAQQSGYRVHVWGREPVWEQFPTPAPRAGEVLIEVEACGVGLTVLNAINGDLGNELDHLPRVPGHELVGRVVGAGAGADSRLLGRRVLAYFYLSCGSCAECMAARDPLCRHLAGNVGVATDGGYAPYTTLPARNVILVPDALDPVAATVVPDAVATPVHVCGGRARVRPGDRVAVIGAGGGVGAHLVQVARLFGASVAALDVDDSKLGALERLGAKAVRSDDFGALDPTFWAEGPPTVVIDLVGSSASLRWAAASLDVRGRLVVLTTLHDRELVVVPREMVLAETTVMGSRYASRREVADAAALVASGRVRPVIGMQGGPESVPGMHAALRAGSLLGRGALIWA